MQEIFRAYPTNKEQLAALKAVAQALKIKFEIAAPEKPYYQSFVESILQGDEDFKAGIGQKITLDELNAWYKM